MNIQNLQIKRSQILSEASTLLSGGLKTEEYRTKHLELITEADALEQDILNLRTIANIRGERLIEQEAEAKAAAVVVTPEEKRSKINRAWQGYLTGENGAEFRDILTASSGADGAALIPEEFNRNYLAMAAKYYAPLLQFCNVIPTNRPVNQVSASDSAAGLSVIAEGAVSPEVDPTFGVATIFHDLFSAGMIKYSNQLASDSGFDLEAFLNRLVAKRVGLGLQSIITTGRDTSGNALTNNPGLLSFATVGTTTTSLAAGIALDDIFNLYDAFSGTDDGYLVGPSAPGRCMQRHVPHC
jgi:HK97 family phage major capsid protein